MIINNYKKLKFEKIIKSHIFLIIFILIMFIFTLNLFYYCSHLGKTIYLTTDNIDNIEEGITSIKMNNIDIGIVEKIILNENKKKTNIKIKIYNGMEKILNNNSLFIKIEPQEKQKNKLELDLPLYKTYIKLQSNFNKNTSKKYFSSEMKKFDLLDSKTKFSLKNKGIRIQLDSNYFDKIKIGDPVLFRGFCVGEVENSIFDIIKKITSYQLFIHEPYDRLITSNIRFWKENNLSFNFLNNIFNIEIGSLYDFFSYGVNFDIPIGIDPGFIVKDQHHYKLFDNKNDINNSIYTRSKNYILFFDSSVKGLIPGSYVEFHGIRIGTVKEVPYSNIGIYLTENGNYQIPVLISIEQDRFMNKKNKDFDINSYNNINSKQELVATLKKSNLLIGSMYIDLDFYPNSKKTKDILTFNNYPIITTKLSNLTELNNKLNAIIDKINSIPIDPIINKTNNIIVLSYNIVKEMESTIKLINKIIENISTKQLPEDIHKTLKEFNYVIKNLKPGSLIYDNLTSNIKNFNQVLLELKSILQTLHTDSNALLFKANKGQDPYLKKAQ